MPLPSNISSFSENVFEQSVQSGKVGFRIAARGLVVQDKRLLFVSDDGHYWYLPGGRLESAEGLKKCVEREVYEETGLIVTAGNLLHVQECLDLRDNIHKIHFYFQTTLIKGDLSDTWSDAGGTVLFRRYFNLNEIRDQKNILPRFLALGAWCKQSEQQELSNVYQGVVAMRGFEMVGADN